MLTALIIFLFIGFLFIAWQFIKYFLYGLTPALQTQEIQRESNWELPRPGVEWDQSDTIESTKHQNKFYRFNIYKRICSCMDNYPNRQGRIVCRHQARFIVNHRNDFGWPEYVFNAYRDVAERGGDNCYQYGTTRDGSPYVIAWSNGNWFSVYRNDSPSRSFRYGYIARDEDKGENFAGAWAYNEPPPCHNEILGRIRDVLESAVPAS